MCDGVLQRLAHLARDQPGMSSSPIKGCVLEQATSHPVVILSTQWQIEIQKYHSLNNVNMNLLFVNVIFYTYMDSVHGPNNGNITQLV